MHPFALQIFFFLWRFKASKGNRFRHICPSTVAVALNAMSHACYASWPQLFI